jgi:ABC-type glycerol-3-phosphate transport system permease component
MNRNRWLAAGILSLIVAVCALPVLWLITSAFRPLDSFLANPYHLPDRLTAGNLRTLWSIPGFRRSLINSASIAVLVGVLSLLICIPITYAASRYSFFGSRVVRSIGLVGYLLSPPILAVPYFQGLSTLSLATSVPGLVIVHLALCIPLCIAMLDMLFRNISPGPEEVARTCGVTGPRLLWQVVLPPVRVPVACVGILMALVSWKEYFFAFLISGGERTRTLPVLLGSLTSGESPQWGLMFAMSLVLVAPAALFILIGFQLSRSLFTEKKRAC